jgi:hypothetical protein
MSKKNAAAATKITAVKKGEIYETQHKDLVEVVNGRLKDEGDLGTSFEGRGITTHEKTGKVVKAKTTDRYYLDDLIRKLTMTDFDEWADAGRREAEAAADAAAPEAATPAPKAKATKKAAKPKPETPAKADGKLSALDAAAKVLVEAGEPMTTRAMIEAMATKGYWTSPGGKTPAATLYSAILREINVKGDEARFTKTDRGLFAAK